MKDARMRSIAGRRAAALALAASIIASASLAANDDPKPKATDGLLRVYVTTSKGEPVGGMATATAFLDYGGGFKKTVALTPVEPKRGASAKDPGAGKHGGEVVKTTEESFELVVFADGAPHATTVPAFEARIPLVLYQDAAKDSPPSEKPGKCPKCGETLEPVAAAFSAVVSARIVNRTVTARTFRWPGEAPPASIAEAAGAIAGQLDRIDAMIADGKLGNVRKATRKIAHSREQIADLAAKRPADEQARIRPALDEIAAACASLDKAAKANDASDCRKLSARLRALAADLAK
jgi:hypothetical protein